MSDLQTTIETYRIDPSRWVDDMFAGKIKLTRQQRVYFQHMAQLIQSKIRKSANGDVSSWPASLQKYNGKVGVSIMAGRGVGKDFCSAMTILWFAMVFPDARVMATGVTGKHLRNVLWAEIAKLQTLSKPLDPEDPMQEGFKLS